MTEIEAETGGVLAGLRVIDAATLYAGPFISTVLADHGADVIKIEPPGGDPYRTGGSALWALLGRGKRSMTLDLRQERGLAILRRLAEHVDVVIVNLLPDALRRRGLDWETLSALNPGLIQVCVTSFGLDGPRANAPGSGTLGEAFSGLTHLTGHPDGKPMLASAPVGDAVTGYVGAFGVLAACYERARTGRGRLVDVNPVDSLLHLPAPALAEWTEGAPVPGRLDGRLAAPAVRNTFRCRDGTWVAISCSTPRHLDQLLDSVGYTGARLGDGDAYDAAVAAWVGRHDRTSVIARLGERRLPVVPVHDARTLHEDDHVRARRALRQVAAAEAGERWVPAAAPRFVAEPDADAASGNGTSDECPGLGEHTVAVLRDLLHLDEAAIQRLRESGVV
ncbi:CaiB/BaiF CoA transferase family protein [Actinomadura rugatobispora]|uniref:CaiB/BaiF CoA transferase family protein n=1 Tax=Actinomadura rugatobispora TaxID=1994 RepID=A0ABW1A1K4_9ACTN|nr:CoA transferase [Actinomadura rugatobispora]